MNKPGPDLDSYVQRIERALDRLLPGDHAEPARLHQAMRYACLGNGKRIRAMLVYAAGAPLDGDPADLDVAAAAVELIHAYSLIHDDLPAMDDDDLRRGRPTCHIAFDEATAILAGDALQARAFGILAEAGTGIPPDNRVKMVALLAGAAGSTGMVGGQVLDLAGEDQSLDVTALDRVHRAKTGALISAAVVMGGLAAPAADPEVLAAYERFGGAVGIAFQIVDDMLDETANTRTLGKRAGADRQAGKSTYPAAVGLDESRRLAHAHYEQAIASLEHVPGDTRLLRNIALRMVERAS